MKITIHRVSNYLVRYFDEEGKEIGYSLTTKRWLPEAKATKERCGVKVHKIEITKRSW